MRAAIPLLSLLLAGCAKTFVCPPAPTFAAAGRPFLWNVTSSSGTIVLFGTLHAAGADDIPARAREALSTAKTFVSEVGDMESDSIRAAATLPRGESLQTMLGADYWYELRDSLIGVIEDENLRHVRPWYAMSLLTSASSNMPRVIMDDALKESAQAHGERLETLEGVDEQLGKLGESVSVDDLKQAIDDRKKMRCEVDKMRVAYRAGDDGSFKDPLGSEAVTQTLLVERNRRWMEKLEGYLRGGGGAFVAVGVGHLVGPGNLPELLRAKGYTVERL